MPTLIITNGDSAAGCLKAADDVEADEILPWRDVLHFGPLEATDDWFEFAETRAAFLSIFEDYHVVRDGFAERDAIVAGQGEFDRIEIWLEHDLYDQLQLVQILDRLGRQSGRTEGVFIVQADDHLGQFSPEDIGRFASGIRPVTGAVVALAARAWDALTRTTPEHVAALAADPMPDLPFLQAALIRFLEELPGTNGLSRSEQQILDHLAADPSSAAELFGKVWHDEEAAFMGDLLVFHLLDGLQHCRKPLIAGLPSAWPAPGSDGQKEWTRSRLSVTQYGESVRTDNHDRYVENEIDLWWGGTCLEPGNIWRYDRRAGVLIAP